ncbi:MAG: Nitrate/nitrite transporter [Pseudomonas sp.]|nr:Nitrate/nitrite transporter [Pseudomonas sp.]
MKTTLLDASGVTDVAVIDNLDAIYRKITRRLIPLLFLCYVLNYLDRINIGYAQLQMRADLSFSDAVYGFGAGMFYVGYFIFEVPSNLFLQKIGARKTLLRIMLCWGLVSAATLFVQTPIQFYAVRFLLGAFEAGFFPGIVLYLTYWYPAERRGRIIALFMTAAVAAGIIAGPVSGWILQNLDGFHGLRGWQWLYVLEGLPSSVIGIVVYFCLVDRPGDARWLDQTERQLIQTALQETPNDVAVTPGPGAGAFKDPKVYLFSVLYFAINFGSYALSFWLPSMIQDLGIRDAQQIGLYSLIPYTFGAIAMVWYGRRSDRRQERHWHFALATFCAATALVITTLTTGHLWTSLMLLAITTAGIVAAYPVFWAAATAQLSKSNAAAGIAVITSLGSLAGVISPAAIGLIKTATGSFTLGFYAVAAVMALGGVVMLRSRTLASS